MTLAPYPPGVGNGGALEGGEVTTWGAWNATDALQDEERRVRMEDLTVALGAFGKGGLEEEAQETIGGEERQRMDGILGGILIGWIGEDAGDVGRWYRTLQEKICPPPVP